MSISLVKKSLELSVVGPPVNINSHNRSKSNDKKSKFKELKKNRMIDEKRNAALLVQKIREKTRKSHEVNAVEVNVRRLLSLSKSSGIGRKQELKLLEKVNKKNKANDKKEPLTTFTEEDFIQFQKEYFAN